MSASAGPEFDVLWGRSKGDAGITVVEKGLGAEGGGR